MQNFIQIRQLRTFASFNFKNNTIKTPIPHISKCCISLSNSSLFSKTHSLKSLTLFLKTEEMPQIQIKLKSTRRLTIYIRNLFHFFFFCRKFLPLNPSFLSPDIF